MTLLISYTDFWQGHDPNNNILTNILRDIFNCDIFVVPPADADVCFVTIYGASYSKVINQFRDKTILWLGENKRPNVYGCKYSISFDFSTYKGTNFRLPLWMSEIDWYGTGLGVIHVSDVKRLLVAPNPVPVDEFQQREFCITIFNNPEGTRLEALRLLGQLGNVVGFGKPFNNWFPTYATYRDKIMRMSGYKFNLCPENSLHPGYYTEKCFHAKVAGCIPIYFADPYVAYDFNANSFLNLYNYPDLSQFQGYLQGLLSDTCKMAQICSAPLLRNVPSLDSARCFIKHTVSRILARY